jgi:diacylglycerol kinase (ATP)
MLHVITQQLKSFKYAFSGLAKVIFTERNMQLHVVAAITVLGFGFYYHLTATEWCLITLCIGLVFSAEMFNTAIEKWIDFVHPQHHKTVGFVKDVAAGAVLVLAIAAAVVGLIIFLPKILA